MGTGKTVTIAGLTIGGADAGNYSVNSSASDGAQITALGLVGSIVVGDKVYDGGTSASVTSSNLAGVISPDVVVLGVGAASFDSKDVGLRTATAALSLSGAGAGNYSVNSVGSDAMIGRADIDGDVSVDMVNAVDLSVLLGNYLVSGDSP